MGTVVCVGGVVAVGKTTLMKKMSDRCSARGVNCKLMLELYTDAVRAMIHTNLPIGDALLFGHRLQMAMDAPDLAKIYDVVLMERGFIDHLAFIEAFVNCGLMPSYLVDWSRGLVQEAIPPLPDRYLVLEITPELACERRRQRDSSGEGVFNLAFMRALKSAYDRLLPQYCGEVLLFDWSKFDQQHCLDELLDQLIKAAPSPA